MIMKSAANGCGRTDCTPAVGEICLDSMLARWDGCYLGDGRVYKSNENEL